MIDYTEMFIALATPFGPDQVRQRSAGGGRQLSYITARHVMIRLDEVVGPAAWWDEYTLLGEDSVLCRLSIRLPDGRVLTKQDAGGYAGMADAGDDDKSAVSDSLKRAAVKFGIGRELYGDGVATLHGAGDRGGFVEPGRQFPAPPAASRPLSPLDGPRPPRPHHHQANGPARQYDGPPKSGKGLFAWTKEQEQRLDLPILKEINAFGKRMGYPGKMTEYDDGQVKQAHAAAMEFIRLHRSEDEAGDFETAGHCEPGEEG